MDEQVWARMDEQADGRVEGATAGQIEGRARASGRETLDEVRVIVVAGIPLGMAMGVLSRLAMMVLRVTSPDHVVGVTSDDGFEIGRLTLGGTYNLVLLGATVGLIGAALYRVIAGRLLGPPWFRYLTVGLGCGAVVGSMLLHADGVDFTLLEPAWLAVSLFIAIPFVFGVLVGPVVEQVRRRRDRLAPGWRRWIVPAVLVACAPVTVVAVVVVALVVVVAVTARDLAAVRRVRASGTYVFVVRSVWLLVALAGAAALRTDLVQIL